jgi:hypothetical protein
MALARQVAYGTSTSMQGLSNAGIDRAPLTIAFTTRQGNTVFLMYVNDGIVFIGWT